MQKRKNSVLKSDLRGIETPSLGPIQSEINELKSDLRGIETRLMYVLWLRFSLLKSDLRGIETSTSMNPYSSLGAC